MTVEAIEIWCKRTTDRDGLPVPKAGFCFQNDRMADILLFRPTLLTFPTKKKNVTQVFLRMLKKRYKKTVKNVLIGLVDWLYKPFHAFHDYSHKIMWIL